MILKFNFMPYQFVSMVVSFRQTRMGSLLFRMPLLMTVLGDGTLFNEK
jgi:hypothetical protein